MKTIKLKKARNAVVLIPETGAWDSMFDGLKDFTDDFMEQREQPALLPRQAAGPA